MTLLEEAKKLQKRNKEIEELCIAWINSEITVSQFAKVLGKKQNNMSQLRSMFIISASLRG